MVGAIPQNGLRPGWVISAISLRNGAFGRAMGQDRLVMHIAAEQWPVDRR
jgi:hypothetical protein